MRAFILIHQFRVVLCTPDVFQIRVLRHEGPVLEPLIHGLFQRAGGLLFLVLFGVDSSYVVVCPGTARVEGHDLLQISDLPAYPLAF
jgi:hypothetical protein